jgi:hypothetical protein
MSAWETVWLCVILAVLLMGLDCWLAARVGASANHKALLREARKIRSDVHPSKEIP